MAVKRDILCVKDLVIDNTGYVGTFLDANRDLIYDYFQDTGLVPNLIAKIKTNSSIGKPIECYVEELTMYNSLIETFILLIEQQTCLGVANFNDLVEELSLECARTYLKCNFGTGHVIDDLIEIIKKRFEAIGIGFMTISGDDCTPFKIY